MISYQLFNIQQQLRTIVFFVFETLLDIAHHFKAFYKPNN